MFKKIKGVAVAVLPFGIVSAAHAELPAAVTTAISGAGTDLTTAATAVIVAMVAFWGLAKVGKKLGWW